MPGEDMLAHVRDRVFPFIKNLSGEDHPFSKYMKAAVSIEVFEDPKLILKRLVELEADIAQDLTELQGVV